MENRQRQKKDYTKWESESRLKLISPSQNKVFDYTKWESESRLKQLLSVKDIINNYTKWESESRLKLTYSFCLTSPLYKSTPVGQLKEIKKLTGSAG